MLGERARGRGGVGAAVAFPTGAVVDAVVAAGGRARSDGGPEAADAPPPPPPDAVAGETKDRSDSARAAAHADAPEPGRAGGDAVLAPSSR